MTDTITDSQDEQSFADIVRDFDQIHIPVFQREYVWKNNELQDLLRDLILLRDEVEEVQFLGAIVGYERPRSRQVRGRERTIDIVDGQQRLLTLYMFAMAIAELTAPHDPDGSTEIAKDFLLVEHRRGRTETTRVIPSFEDRAQFLALWDRILSAPGLDVALEAHRQTLPARSGPSDGALIQQYNRILRFLRNNLHGNPDKDVSALNEILDFITRRFTFVVLKLADAANATSIFERLNFRGKRVGIVDLVRNEVFSRVRHMPDDAMNLYHNVWRPFESSFDGRAEHFFFPYSLIHDNNTTKSQLFRELRVIWDGLNPAGIIEHMKPYQTPFMAVDQGEAIFDDRDINLRLDRLNRLGRPTSVYPFLMSLLLRHRCEPIPTITLTNILDLIESFLVRRAIVGFEPTGLHALFKGLWHEVASDLSTNSVAASINRRGTIQWPSDKTLREAIATRGIASSKICKYLLVEYDRDLPGDSPIEVPTIEHVMPDSREDGSIWSEKFSNEEHRDLKDTWANLVPLSAPLNESLQRSPYLKKSDRYARESMFATPRYVADTWSDWTPTILAERATELGNWAVDRWPYGGSTP